MIHAAIGNQSKKSKALSRATLLFFLALLFTLIGILVWPQKITPKDQLLELKGELTDVFVQRIKMHKNSYDETHLYLLNDADHQTKKISLDGKYDIKENSSALVLAELNSKCNCYKARELYVDGKKIFDYNFSVASSFFPGVVFLIAAMSCGLFGKVFINRWRKLPDINI